MHEGVFFSASLVFSKDMYQKWLDTELLVNKKVLKFPYSYLEDSDFAEVKLGKKGSVQQWLNFLEQQNKNGEEFCEFAYVEKTRKFTMEAYLTTVDVFEEWAKAFGLMISSAALCGAKGYGSFSNDNGLTDISCFYTFVAEKNSFQTLFYDYYDEEKKWLPFKKIWTKKRWTELREKHETWLKKFAKKSFTMKSAGNFGFINNKGDFVIPPTFMNARCFYYGLAAVQGGSSSKWGYIDEQGVVVIPQTFFEAYNFLCGVARVRVDTKKKYPNNRLYGFIDAKGKFVIEPQFVEVEDFVDGRALFKEKGKKGFLDTKGSIVIPPVFVEAWAFANERALVMDGSPYDQNTRCGYIDLNGKMIAPFIFKQAWHFCDGFAPVLNEKGWGYLKPDGSFLVEPSFEQVEYFQKGFAKVKQGGKWGIIDVQGKFVIEPKYEDIQHFPFESNKQAVFGVVVGGKYGLIRDDGKVLVKPQYINIKPFQGNYGAVQIANGKWGYIDLDGEMKIAAQFDNAGSFGEERAFVWQKGVCGIIDTSGKFIVKPTFDYSDVGNFKNGVTYTEKYERYGLITREGKVLFKPQFEVLQGFSEKRILVKFPKL